MIQALDDTYQRILGFTAASALTSADSGTSYGLGVMVIDAPDGNERVRWIGHAGGTPGASAIVAFSPADNAIVAVALTGDSATVPSAQLLLKAVSP